MVSLASNPARDRAVPYYYAHRHPRSQSLFSVALLLFPHYLPNRDATVRIPSADNVSPTVENWIASIRTGSTLRGQSGWRSGCPSFKRGLGTWRERVLVLGMRALAQATVDEEARLHVREVRASHGSCVFREMLLLTTTI